MATPIYNETQRFRQIWIWAILLGVTALVMGAMVNKLLNDPQATLVELIFPVVLLLLINGLFFSMRLTTRIDASSLTFSYFPFLSQRKYDWTIIESMELITYNGLVDYGGWGIKWNGECWSYTTGGKWGILVRTSTKKFLLGTHHPEKVKEVISYFMEIKSSSNGN